MFAHVSVNYYTYFPIIYQKIKKWEYSTFSKYCHFVRKHVLILLICLTSNSDGWPPSMISSTSLVTRVTHPMTVTISVKLTCRELWWRFIKSITGSDQVSVWNVFKVRTGCKNGLQICHIRIRLYKNKASCLKLEKTIILIGRKCVGKWMSGWKHCVVLSNLWSILPWPFAPKGGFLPHLQKWYTVKVNEANSVTSFIISWKIWSDLLLVSINVLIKVYDCVM